MKGKKFLGVIFSCCNVYNRIYINRDETAYAGRCPKCMKNVNVKIGSGGTSTRFFEAV